MKVLVKGVYFCLGMDEKTSGNWAVGFDQSNCCCYDDKC